MKKTERFPLMMEERLVERIDDFRHANRIGSRAEAVRRLINIGLGAKKKVATTGTRSPNSDPADACNINHQETKDAGGR